MSFISEIWHVTCKLHWNTIFLWSKEGSFYCFMSSHTVTVSIHSRFPHVAITTSSDAFLQFQNNQLMPKRSEVELISEKVLSKEESQHYLQYLLNGLLICLFDLKIKFTKYRMECFCLDTPMMRNHICWHQQFYHWIMYFTCWRGQYETMLKANVLKKMCFFFLFLLKQWSVNIAFTARPFLSLLWDKYRGTLTTNISWTKLRHTSSFTFRYYSVCNWPMGRRYTRETSATRATRSFSFGCNNTVIWL